jgi:hypothetical protein
MSTVLITCIILAYSGFESLTRVSIIFFIPIIAGTCMILLLAAPNYNFNLLKPYGGFGLNVTITSGILRSSAYVEFMILALVAKAVHGYKEFKRIGYTSIILTGIVLSGIAFFYLSCFGFGVGSENISGMFELSRTIYFNRFFQRVESVFLFIWVISAVISVAVSLYMSALIYCKIFKIKNHSPILFPLSLVTYIIAFLPESLQAVINVNIKYLRSYSLFVIYLPIALIFVLSLVFRKRGRRADA